LADVYGQHHHAYSGGTRVLVRNGVLDIETGQVTLNTPLWFSLARIEAHYDHRADPYADGDWLRMLHDQWGDDPGAVTCLQQWFGYVLSGRTDLQKWMLIIGPSGSGKSIIADVLGTLLGVVNATKLDTLNSQFGLQALYETGATLAVMSDIRFGARDSSTAVGNLLAVTGEDEVTIERKYKTAVSARLPVRFHGSANEMPRWSDNSSALQRRALILETSRGFRGTDDDDPGLKRRIILGGELSQVLRWAVEGLALLNASGGRFTRSSGADELDAELSELSSPVRTFVNECCEIGTGEDFVDLKPLYTVWQGWAETNNTGKGMSQNKFRAALKALYLDPVKPGQKALPDGKPGKWLVVWGVRRAQTTVIGRSPNGLPVQRVVSTDPLGDPWRGGNY
jgi:putative DNA primase/helicase